MHIQGICQWTSQTVTSCSLLSRPNPLTRNSSGVTNLNPWACRSLWSLSVELEIAQCWIMNLITRFERYDWSICSRFHIIPIYAALRFDWPLHTSGASPRIWTCDNRPLLLTWAGWGLGTRPSIPPGVQTFCIFVPRSRVNIRKYPSWLLGRTWEQR